VALASLLHRILKNQSRKRSILLESALDPRIYFVRKYRAGRCVFGLNVPRQLPHRAPQELDLPLKRRQAAQ
jgi:hypothetical protein